MSFPRFDSDYSIAVKSLPTKQAQRQDNLNAVTSAIHSIPSITALPVGNLARETTPVSLTSLPAISVIVSLRNSRLNLNIDVCVSGSRRHRIPILAKMILTWGDDGDAFSGSQADLEGAAENLFSSPPRPQPLRFESLSLKTPQTVPPTPGTALQNKIESRLEKSLGSTFSIQLKQEMGVFQASMLEAMKSLKRRNALFQKKPPSRM